jgi:hypothetical protein
MACSDSGRFQADAGVDARRDAAREGQAAGDGDRDTPADTGPGDGGAELGADGAPGTPSDGGARAFALLVTETPPGPRNADPANWGGVRQYVLEQDGAALVPAAGIAASALADPSALAFRDVSSEVFVANRHGNDLQGSVSRFRYDRPTRTFSDNGQIVGNGLSAVHQLAFHPQTGELFAANHGGGVSRFTFDGAGRAVANGTIASGSLRGVGFSPDGRRLYVTDGGDRVRAFEIASGAELGAVQVPGASAHYLARRGADLYLAGFGNSAVHRLAIGAGGVLSGKDQIPAAFPIAVAFSPDGLEMFAPAHQNATVIGRFGFVPATDAWTAAPVADTGTSLGGALTIPLVPAVVGPGG